MSEGIVYDGSAGSMRRLVELHPQRARFVCSAYGVGLVVALTWAGGVARSVRPGVYCPALLEHLCENFIPREPSC